jgi:hypothetical protein
MKNSRPVSSDSRPSGPFLTDQQRQSSPRNDGGAPHHRQECMCSSPWDAGSCIPIQRKNSHSLRSFLPGFDDVPGLGPLDSDNSLNDSSTSTLDGISSILSTCSSPSWPRRKHQKQLRWGKVEMRFYPVMPGDHPDTAKGPPVSPPLILCLSMGAWPMHRRAPYLTRLVVPAHNCLGPLCYRFARHRHLRIVKNPAEPAR